MIGDLDTNCHISHSPTCTFPGEPAVGKSSIFLRYTKNQFDYSYQPSISVAIGNVVKKINIPYQGVVSVVIWDVPGREEMDLRKSYYKDVDAAIGTEL